MTESGFLQLYQLQTLCIFFLSFFLNSNFIDPFFFKKIKADPDETWDDLTKLGYSKNLEKTEKTEKTKKTEKAEKTES